ncbi:MAG TPA: hypothetical protein PLR28_10770, partial [Dokdonella sp.]|nr:hypothetical protein [Dokdonella sp.]
KAHRDEGRFEVKGIHLETGMRPDVRMTEALAVAVQACADWHETPKVTVRRSDPRPFAGELRRALQALRA